MAKMGKNMKHALDFATKYPGWYYYDYRNIPTRNAINNLVKLGLVEIAPDHSFRLKPKQENIKQED